MISLPWSLVAQMASVLFNLAGFAYQMYRLKDLRRQLKDLEVDRRRVAERALKLDRDNREWWQDAIVWARMMGYYPDTTPDGTPFIKIDSPPEPPPERDICFKD